ncbi:hypothetical protein [Paenibacillus hamazuiensis]|uniref:hypothetical protein n=1 Tax=Paenibacillus hamazuiensis TaxID=2936508 RepID=UPI002010AF1D|nr:hypothetical protein [Paenibacillus hamazuiensis]
MKEAIIVDKDGFYLEPTLVDDHVSGVFPLSELSGSRDYTTGSQIDTSLEIFEAYQVAISVPPGLYKPRFDFEAGEWTEGLSPEEIDTLRSKSQPQTIEHMARGLPKDALSLESRATVSQDDYVLQLMFDLQQRINDQSNRIADLEYHINQLKENA